MWRIFYRSKLKLGSACSCNVRFSCANSSIDFVSVLTCLLLDLFLRILSARLIFWPWEGANTAVFVIIHKRIYSVAQLVASLKNCHKTNMFITTTYYDKYRNLVSLLRAYICTESTSFCEHNFENREHNLGILA